METPFTFKSCVIQVELTGRNARSLTDFAAALSEVPDGSIIHHLHHSFLRHDLDVPDFTNDFSNWVHAEVEDRVLAEKLANVAPFEFPSIDKLRAHLIQVVEGHLFEKPNIAAMEFEPFYFDTATMLVFTVDNVNSITGFKTVLKHTDASSIYYHWFESRLRRGRHTDDFSHWFEELGYPKLAAATRSIDPYMHSLEELRELLLGMLEAHIPQFGGAP